MEKIYPLINQILFTTSGPMRSDYSIKSPRLCFYGVLVIAFLSVITRAETRYIRLRTATLSTEDTKPSIQPQSVLKDEVVSGLYLLQFQNRLQVEWKKTMKEFGASFISYVPDDACIVRLNKASIHRLRSLAFVRWIGPYAPDYRIDPTLLTPGPVVTDIPQKLRILACPDTPIQEMQDIQKILDAGHSSRMTSLGPIIQGTVSADRLKELTSHPSVLWVEPVLPLRLYDEAAVKIIGGSLSTNNHSAAIHDWGYTGRGVRIAVADTGLDGGENGRLHPDLNGRVDAYYFYGALRNAADEDGHGTHVAGIIAGNGATGEADTKGYLYGMGIAPESRLIIQRIFDGDGYYAGPDTGEALTRDALQAGAKISSNSWGADNGAHYDLLAAEFDALVRDGDFQTDGDQQMTLVFAAGNAGPAASTLSTPAVGKNVITVGASGNSRTDFSYWAFRPDDIASFSSRGPCNDGRIKPDVLAPGVWISSLNSSSAKTQSGWLEISDSYQYMGGTSQATPHVSGAAGVFTQWYREHNANTNPSPALIKAALIDSARSLNTSNPSNPNNQEGWGRISLTNLFSPNTQRWFLDQSVLLETHKDYERTFMIAGPSQPLRIIMAYTDVPSIPAAMPSLVNDLDLELLAPDGAIYRGNQIENGYSIPYASGRDSLNNVECILIKRPQPGEYRLRIHGKNIVQDSRRDTAAVDQDFACVISGDLATPGAGIISLDRAAYSSPSTIKITLVDEDLSGALSAPIHLNSSSHPGGITVALSSANASGTFTGTVTTVSATLPAINQLLIGQGDLIKAEYEDASSKTIRTATASVDLVNPRVLSFKATNYFGRTLVQITTDEPTSGHVYYGTNDGLWQISSDLTPAITHSIVLTNVTYNATNWYWFSVSDLAGNGTTNNNQGQFYSVFVKPLAEVLLIDAYQASLFDTVIPLSSYTNALRTARVPFEVWNVKKNGGFPTLNNLLPYRVVIWRPTDDYFNSKSFQYFGTTQANTLKQYLDAGGALLLASMEILSYVDWESAFPYDVLHVDDYYEDYGVPSIVGSDTDPFSKGIDIQLDYNAYPRDSFFEIGPDFSDYLVPSTNAVPFIFDQETSLPVGIRYPASMQSDSGKVIFLSFPLDAIPTRGTAPNNRSAFLANMLNFLAPGINGNAHISFDANLYTIPSRPTIQLIETDLAGRQRLAVSLYTDSNTNRQSLELLETSRRGIFKGEVALNNLASPASSGTLQVTNGNQIWVEYYDDSIQEWKNASAKIDTIPPLLSNITSQAFYHTADITWKTSKPADATLQYGESVLLGYSVYSSAFEQDHSLKMVGLRPDREYYYQISIRDLAGNVTIDNNGGRFYKVHTLIPLSSPWSDDMESGTNHWQIHSTEDSGTTWELGVPGNSMATSAHSPKNAWGTNLKGKTVDYVLTSLVSPGIKIDSSASATLYFWHQYNLNSMSLYAYEAAFLDITTNGGMTWESIAEYENSSRGWKEEHYDLSQYSGNVVFFSWSYYLNSMDTETWPGWLVDDISLVITNKPIGTIHVTNNLSQATFLLSGPANFQSQGWNTVFTNVPAGNYVITYKPILYYQSPPPQTNQLAPNKVLLFNGNYTFADTNHNGISDSWEFQFFGKETPQIPLNLRDSDGDNLTDYEEFIAGTNPLEATSKLALLKPGFQTNGVLHIEFLSSIGRSYMLESSDNLLNWIPQSDWLRASGTRSDFSIPTSNLPQPLFLRLLAKP